MTRIAVMGAGALGMLLAGKLAAAGEAPVVWTRTTEQARLLNQRGLTLEGTAAGSGQVVSVHAVASGDVTAGFSGYVLITLKQTAVTAKLLHWMSRSFGRDAVPVFFQNGIGHMEAAAVSLRGRKLTAAVTTEAALRTGPASVRHTGIGETWIGEWEEAAPTKLEPLTAPPHLDELQRMLKQAGFSVFVSKEIRERMLRKLLVNAVINPLTALWRVPNGGLNATAERRSAMEMLFRETADILRVHGFRDMSTEALWALVLDVCVSTADNRSSMLQDITAGRETEIDALNGAVCRMAAMAGKQAPWNAAVTALVKAIRSPKERGI